MPFEILHRFFVLLGGGFGFERAEIAALASLRIFLSRIKPIAAFHFSNHGEGVSLGVGDAVSFFDVAHAPRCFLRAALSESSNRSM